MKSRIKRQAGVLCSVMMVVLVSGVVLPGAASGQAASRVGQWFLFGSNMPWLNWAQDFGGGPNSGGVSGNTAEVDTKLRAARDAGMHIMRWWVFEGGSRGIQRDAGGTPTGLDPNVYTDLDAALTVAAKYDVSYNLVLFGSTNDDSTTHQWWEDSAKRQALARVLAPLFQRYASNPRVQTWEIVNEPEWQSRNGITSQAGMLATGDALANAIHHNSTAMVTVGNAQIQDMQTWVGHPLDYYSPHYYDNFGTGANDPFLNSASSPDGKPVVIGEFPASTGLNPDAPTRWNELYSRGYAGGWNWSLSPEHTSDRLATDLNAATAFSAGKSDLGPRPGAVPPTATRVPATPTNTAVPPTPTNTATPVSAPPTKTATPTPAPGQTNWILSASVNSASVARGSGVRVSDRSSANQNAQALVDVEIYDPNWNKVYQHVWDNQSFIANRPRNFNTTWTVPTTAATGTYTVTVGAFGPGWNGVYSFNKNTATFTVR